MRIHSTLTAGAMTLALIGLAPGPALAHCDGLDGPVVKAAQAALETGQLARALMWVRAEDEAEIEEAFNRTLAVRSLGGEARALADRYFFETLVRIHRLGEGASYTGLKPAGRDLGPAIPAADRALEVGSPDDLVALFVDAMDDALRDLFAEAVETRRFDPADVEAGRRHVRSYVALLHFVERLHEVIATPAHGHGGDR